MPTAPRNAQYKKKIMRKKRQGSSLGWIVLIAVLLIAGVILVAVLTKRDAEPDVSSVPAASASSQTVSSSPWPTAQSADWRLQIASKRFPLSSDYKPELKEVENTHMFDARAVDEFKAMLAAAKKDGLPLFVVSTYRSSDQQKTIYQQQIQRELNRGLNSEEAVVAAGKEVAPPYTSEHNLALSADIVSGDWYNTHSEMTQEFEDTNEHKWLMEHCAEYGFVLRYPKNKEAITDIIYEPWHFRYVGKEYAKEMMEKGMCLEEYVAYLNSKS